MVMQAPRFISRLLKDPPPRFVFELSESGIAVGRAGRPPRTGFQGFDPGVVVVSPVEDNVRDMDALSRAVRPLAPPGEKKRQRAVLILPDFSVRVSVLDFDAFPSEPSEQKALVRFRIKKSLPFDVDSAAISYFPQHVGKKWDVVAAAVPLSILARYEAPFRAAGFHPGVVTTSSLCALEMAGAAGVSVMAKLSGRILTLAVGDRGTLKLMRTLELSEGSAEEIIGHLFQTLAFVEDQLGARPKQILTCGLGDMAGDIEYEFPAECAPLRSRLGLPDASNAGLHGYLEAHEELAA
jgi:type IV pilus assembly protein PilM